MNNQSTTLAVLPSLNKNTYLANRLVCLHQRNVLPKANSRTIAPGETMILHHPASLLANKPSLWIEDIGVLPVEVFISIDYPRVRTYNCTFWNIESIQMVTSLRSNTWEISWYRRVESEDFLDNSAEVWKGHAFIISNNRLGNSAGGISVIELLHHFMVDTWSLKYSIETGSNSTSSAIAASQPNLELRTYAQKKRDIKAYITTSNSSLTSSRVIEVPSSFFEFKILNCCQS